MFWEVGSFSASATGAICMTDESWNSVISALLILAKFQHTTNISDSDCSDLNSQTSVALYLRYHTKLAAGFLPTPERLVLFEAKRWQRYDGKRIFRIFLVAHLPIRQKLTLVDFLQDITSSYCHMAIPAMVLPYDLFTHLVFTSIIPHVVPSRIPNLFSNLFSLLICSLSSEFQFSSTNSMPACNAALCRLSMCKNASSFVILVLKIGRVHASL